MKLKMSEKNTFSVAEKKEKKVQPSEKYSNYDMDNIMLYVRLTIIFVSESYRISIKSMRRINFFQKLKQEVCLQKSLLVKILKKGHEKSLLYMFILGTARAW